MESSERNNEKDESPRNISSPKEEENEEIEEVQDTALQQEKKKYINLIFC